MADLTGLLDQHNPGQVVEAWCVASHKPRTRLGLSEIGHHCPRYLWYRHHGYPLPIPDGRVLRLFRLGELIEEQAIIDLKSAGYTMHSHQHEIMFSDNGIELTGHIDGVIEGLVESKQPHLWECKSSSNKRFTELKKTGYEAWDEKYKTQIHVYMLGMRLKRCLVWVENKDTSEIYTERIHLDREYAVQQLQRAFAAIESTNPPERACTSQSWYLAKWCGYSGECFQNG